MDDTDWKILNILRLDARKPFLEIAKKLGISDATIHCRIKKMIADGVIKGFETIVDEEKLGYSVTAFIEIKIKPGTANKAGEKLSKLDGVLEVHEIHGHCDLLLKLKVKGLSALREKLVREIKSIAEVVSCEAFTTLKIVKEEHGIPVLI